MRYIDLNNVREAGYRALPPGGYICKITKVEDKPEREYLEICYDIAEGEFRDYYQTLRDKVNPNYWGGKDLRSYKEKALPYFKAFVTAVERSNPGYVFDYNEHGLAGKYVGIVLGEEEYINTNGEIKTRLRVDCFRSVDEIRNGNFKVPAPKRLTQMVTNVTNNNIPML